MIPTDWVDPNAAHENLVPKLDFEIGEGYRAIQHLIEPMVGMEPDTELPELLQQGADRTRGIFSRLYRYAYLGELDPLLHHDDLHDALAFLFGCRPLSEFYNLEVPIIAESTLNILVARAKVDKQRGFSTAPDIEFWNGAIADAGNPNLTIREIAWLARMEERSVRNATLSTGDGRLEVIKDGARVSVDPGVAEAWLAKRQGYLPTRDPEPLAEDEVLVPIASDGSFFSAACRRSRGYQVGRKGDEHYLEDLWEALAVLNQMGKAYWRRPNEHGRFGIVTAVRWERVARDQFLTRNPQATGTQGRDAGSHQDDI